MEKVRPWCGQPSDRGRLRNRTESQRSGIGCLPYFHTWCGLSADLECMSEMCCTRLAENTGSKKSPFWHHCTTSPGCIFTAEACIDNRKNLLIVRPSGSGTVHSRPHKIFLHFHDLWTILNKIREGVALSLLSILHKTH